jgi:hypothetical protein
MPSELEAIAFLFLERRALRHQGEAYGHHETASHWRGSASVLTCMQHCGIAAKQAKASLRAASLLALNIGPARQRIDIAHELEAAALFALEGCKGMSCRHL